MARLKYGLYGPIIGKLGNHVGYIRRGEGVIRMKSSPSHKPKTLKQKAAFDRMRVVMEFISPLNDFFNVSFKPAITGTTKIPQNQAVSENIKTAVAGVYPELEMDYSKAVVSTGDLLAPENVQISYTLEGEIIDIQFAWDVDPNWGYSIRREQIMMAAYLPDNKKAFSCVSGARRNAGEDVLRGKINLGNKPGTIKDQTIELYMCFVSDDRMSVSDSIYAGRIELP